MNILGLMTSTYMAGYKPRISLQEISFCYQLKAGFTSYN